MKKSKRILLTALPLLAMLITGCSISGDSTSATSEPASTSSSIPEPYVNENVHIEMGSMMKKGYYDLVYKYDDNFFLTDAKVYNKELAELSFGNSTITYKAPGLKFFEDCQYHDVVAHDYDTTAENTIGYFFAHKQIKEYEIFNISFRGFDYKQEWANNFVLGASGDHEGFMARASETYTALQNYIAQYSSGRKVKLWLNGYSRGGAIANVLSYLILSGDKIAVEQSDMYVYTFEAPQGLSTEHAIKYENVHNIVNNADFITYFAPSKFGLARCGVDHDIYNSDVSKIVNDFDNELVIADFVEVEVNDGDDTVVITGDKQFTEYVLKCLTNSSSEDPSKTMNTREQYVNNYQQSISAMLGLVFSLKNETLLEVIDDISSKGMWELITLVSSGKAMEAYLAPYFAKDGVTYDKEKVVGYLDTLIKNIMAAYLSSVIPLALGDGKTDLSRMVHMHFPEVSYALLKYSHREA